MVKPPKSAGLSTTLRRSGHAAGTKEFYKYVNIAEEYLNDEVKKTYKKLLEPSIPGSGSAGTKAVFI